MPSHLDSNFSSIFHRFLPPTSIPWTLKIIVFPMENNVFFKTPLFARSTDFQSSWVPTCLSKSTKIDQKSMPRCLPMFISFFDRFLLPTWTPWTQFGASGLAFSWFFRFRGNIDLGSDFGANMPPFFLQKSTKILPKIDPKMHHFFDRFLHRFFFDFGSILEAILEPSRPLFPSEGGWLRGQPFSMLRPCYFSMFVSS